MFGHFGKNVCPQQLTLIGKPWSTNTSHAPKPTKENHAFHRVNAQPVFLTLSPWNLQPYMTISNFPSWILYKTPKLRKWKHKGNDLQTQPTPQFSNSISPTLTPRNQVILTINFIYRRCTPPAPCNSHTLPSVCQTSHLSQKQWKYTRRGLYIEANWRDIVSSALQEDGGESKLGLRRDLHFYLLQWGYWIRGPISILASGGVLMLRRGFFW